MLCCVVMRCVVLVYCGVRLVRCGALCCGEVCYVVFCLKKRCGVLCCGVACLLRLDECCVECCALLRFLVCRCVLRCFLRCYLAWCDVL